MSTCKEGDVEKCEDQVQMLLRNMASATVQMMQGTENFNKHYNRILYLTTKIRKECLQGIDESEEEIIKDVRQTHTSKRNFVKRICDEKMREMTRRRDEQVGRAEQLMEYMTNMQHSTQALMDTHQSLRQQVKLLLEQLNEEVFIPVKLRLSNKGLKAFDSSKTVVVEEEVAINGDVTSRSEAETRFVKNPGFDGQLQTLKTQPIIVQKMAEIGDRVYQLQLVEDQLWALKRDRIDVFDRNGSVSQTYTPGFTDALDMCVSGLSHVIVATESSGLLQLTSKGRMSRCIDEGSYLTVTSSDQDSVWAVKEEEEKLWTVKYKISADKCEQVVRCQTSISPEGSFIYCALLGHTLYLSFYDDNCIYAVDTSNGRTLSTHGNTSRGQLHGPRGIYSDYSSNSLFIIDCSSHRFQLFEPTMERWSLLETTGAELEYPRTVVVDRHGQMWITGGDYNSCLLYKFIIKGL